MVSMVLKEEIARLTFEIAFFSTVVSPTTIEKKSIFKSKKSNCLKEKGKD